MSYKWCKLQIIKLIVLKVMVDEVRRSKPKFGTKIDFLAGSNSEAIQHIMLKLTMGECLNRHYVRTKFRPNPRGSGIFCVDLTWNDPVNFECEFKYFLKIEHPCALSR